MSRSKKGTVIGDKMEKTLVVQVHTYKLHPKYKKRYRMSKKYIVDNPQGEYKVGDEVTIYETRPLSKTKRWTVVAPEKKAAAKTA